MADGLLFYKTYNVNNLNDCEQTAAFCKKLNDFFDALNRKFGLEGLRSNGKNLIFIIFN